MDGQWSFVGFSSTETSSAFGDQVGISVNNCAFCHILFANRAEISLLSLELILGLGHSAAS